MRLKDKFKLPIDANNNINDYVSDQCEKIAEDFAIDFVVWMANQDYNLETDYKKEHIKEALEIYKKQL